MPWGKTLKRTSKKGGLICGARAGWTGEKLRRNETFWNWVFRDQYRIHSLIWLRHETLRNSLFEWERKVSCLFSLSLTFLMNCQGVSLFPVFIHKFFHTRCICFYFWKDRGKKNEYCDRDTNISQGKGYWEMANTHCYLFFSGNRIQMAQNFYSS